MRDTAATDDPPARPENLQPSEVRVPQQRTDEGPTADEGHTWLDDDGPEPADGDDKTVDRQVPGLPRKTTSEVTSLLAEPTGRSLREEDRSSDLEPSQGAGSLKEWSQRPEQPQPSETRVPQQHVDKEGPGDGHILTGGVKEDGEPGSADGDDKTVDRRVDPDLRRETTEEARDAPEYESATTNPDTDDPPPTVEAPSDQRVSSNKHTNSGLDDANPTSGDATTAKLERPAHTEATDQTRAAADEVNAPPTRGDSPTEEPATASQEETQTSETASTVKKPKPTGLGGLGPQTETVVASSEDHLDGQHEMAPSTLIEGPSEAKRRSRDTPEIGWPPRNHESPDQAQAAEPPSIRRPHEGGPSQSPDIDTTSNENDFASARTAGEYGNESALLPGDPHIDDKPPQEDLAAAGERDSKDALAGAEHEADAMGASEPPRPPLPRGDGLPRDADIMGRKFDDPQARPRTPTRTADDYLSAGDPVYHGPNSTAIGYDSLTMRNFDVVKPEPGYHDVVVHGEPNGTFRPGLIGEDGADYPANYTHPNQIADAIRNNPNYTGGPVRLVSCHSGTVDPEAGVAPAAQQVANLLGVPVVAPNDAVGVSRYGSGAQVPRIRGGGTWIPFHPQSAS